MSLSILPVLILFTWTIVAQCQRTDWSSDKANSYNCAWHACTQDIMHALNVLNTKKTSHKNKAAMRLRLTSQQMLVNERLGTKLILWLIICNTEQNSNTLASEQQQQLFLIYGHTHTEKCTRRHTDISESQTYIWITKMQDDMMINAGNVRSCTVNDVKGRGVNWLHFAIQV